VTVGAGSSYDTQGPMFIGEPPSKVEFTNSSGGRVDCSARGNPTPTVEWLGPDNLAVPSIPSIRLVLNNGSIYFPPFEAEVFRQDVHWAVYRCLVTNSVGVIVSRDVTIKAACFFTSFITFLVWTTQMKEQGNCFTIDDRGKRTHFNYNFKIFNVFRK
ncbi:hypothetical protein L9F63_023831, partial [Diploptera punctata]